ncbi:MAG: tetratricopeptide repeat protein, partial [Mesorhizobium sp.]
GKDLPRLQLDVPKGTGEPEEMDMLAYAARDSWGGEAKGMLVFRVKSGEGAEGEQVMASLEAEQKQQVLQRGIHVTGAAEAIENRDVDVPIGASAPVEIAFEIRADSGAAKPAKMKLSPSVDPCDLAAGEPLDLQGVVPGLLPNEIGADAVKLCEAAVKAYPDVARFRYELGRALLAAGKVDQARKAIQQAADRGHVRAVFE